MIDWSYAKCRSRQGSRQAFKDAAERQHAGIVQSDRPLSKHACSAESVWSRSKGQESVSRRFDSGGAHRRGIVKADENCPDGVKRIEHCLVAQIAFAARHHL